MRLLHPLKGISAVLLLNICLLIIISFTGARDVSACSACVPFQGSFGHHPTVYWQDRCYLDTGRTVSADEIGREIGVIEKVINSAEVPTAHGEANCFIEGVSLYAVNGMDTGEGLAIDWQGSYYLFLYAANPEIAGFQLIMEREEMDRLLRMNQLQYLGTHNSYHLQPQPELLRIIRFFCKRGALSWEYSHRPLTEQLELLNIRQLELDVYADPEGGVFSHQVGRSLIGKETNRGLPELEQPGFKVVHVPHLDYETTVLTLEGALKEIRDWSLANPDHLPVMVLVEVKEDLILDKMSWFWRGLAKLGRFYLGLFGIPVKFPPAVGAADLQALDDEIRAVFAEDHLITPDQVRGSYSTLEEAIIAEGWPTLGEARGRIIFALDNLREIRDLYLEGRPSLESRVMFVSSSPGQPSAAFIKMNNPTGDNFELIQSYIRQGYLVRTMSDGNQLTVRDGDTTRRDTALSSGAQFISTDFPEPAPWGYQVYLPGAEGYAARSNPVNGPVNIDPSLLE